MLDKIREHGEGITMAVLIAAGAATVGWRVCDVMNDQKYDAPPEKVVYDEQIREIEGLTREIKDQIKSNQ